MPFGVINASAVFQHLMQKILSRIQCDGGNEFVSVYLDNVIIFSESLQDHITHLKAVFDYFRSEGLKLNPKKCKFICDEVEYLGHLVTPTGLKPNNLNLDAVKNFPTPTNLRQFLGLTSHYHRFVLGYTRIAHPLYLLTKKGTVFQWTADREVSFES